MIPRRTAGLCGLALLAVACTTSPAGSTLGPSTTVLRPASTPGSTQTTASTAPLLATDGVTVTADTINIGVLADLSGPFSGQAIDALDAQIAFWSELNRQGGIGGRSVELVIADTASIVDTHVRKYQELMPRVVMFSHSTGSDQTLAIASRLGADQRLVVPLSNYSGWSDPVIGDNIVEIGPNACVEGINTVAVLAERFGQSEGRPPRLAVVTSPGLFGEDPAAGATFAADSLRLDVVYRGIGALVAGEDISPVVAAVARSGADITFIATDPITLATVMAGSVQLGYGGQWTGPGETFNSRLLDTALGDLIAQRVSVPIGAAPLGAPVEGMSDVYARLAELLPDRYPSDALVRGYLQFEATRQILGRALELGDLTPSGVVRASRQIESMSYQGLAPPNLSVDDPNLAVSRASGLGHLDKTLFDAQGGLGASLAEGAVSPLVVDLPFAASDLVTRYDFGRPCSVGPG